MSDSESQKPAAGKVAGALAVVAALAAAAWWLAPRPVAWQKPASLGQAEAFPESIQRDHGAWYWIERPPKKPALLVRATPGNRATIASADAVSTYTLADGKLVWASRTGARWSVSQAGADGKSPQTLWSGADEPLGVRAVDGKLYWVRRIAAAVPDAGPFPPLNPVLEVVALEPGASAPTRLARLPESEDAGVLGIWGGSLLVAAWRRDAPGCTSLYRVGLKGEPPVRFDSALRQTQPLLTRAGELYGLVESEEPALPLDTLVLMRFTADGRKERVSDWLPAGGFLYETARGVLYGDRDSPNTLWAVRGPDQLPDALAMPADYYGIAAGERELLLGSQFGRRDRPELFEVLQP